MNADDSGLARITNLDAGKSLFDVSAHHHASYPVWLSQ